MNLSFKKAEGKAELYTVVYHLDIVSGTGLTDPVTAGFAFDLGSSGLEYFFDGGPCIGGTTRHEGRAISSTLLTPGDT